MRVLVVEDDPELGPPIVDGLRAAGFAVDIAERLEEADLKASVNAYDCVVADRGLPDGDALELLKKWRRSGCAIPVLMLTSFGTVEDRVAGVEHRAHDYLFNPFPTAHLPPP